MEMEVTDFLVNSIQQYPNCGNYLIGNLFFYAAGNENYKLLVDNAKFINFVDEKQIKNIVEVLCDNKKYDIIMILSEYTAKITSKMFLLRKHVSDIFNLENNNFIQKFLTRFPEIISSDIKNLSSHLYKRDIEMFDFVIKMCQDEYIINGYLQCFVINACKNNDLDMIKYLLGKYHDRISGYIKEIVNDMYNDVNNPETMGLILKTYDDIFDDNFYQNFYNNLFKKNNITLMKYMFDNFNFDYTDSYYYAPFSNTNMMTIKMILDDTITKKFSLPLSTANSFFIKYCLHGEFSYAYKIKYHYPEICVNNIRCHARNKKLRDWLNDGCPITKMTKSSNKVI